MANVGFLRYFTSDPGDDVLLQIEGVSIIDTPPPAPVQASGTGLVCVVAELEDGEFNAPTQVVSGNDFQTNWGAFGYTYNGAPAQNPCARSRKADSALTPEYWNGNGAVAVSGKVFNQLVVCRVDTHVGVVQFTRCASIRGQAMFTYALQSGQHLDTESPTAHSTTFTGVAAVVTSAATPSYAVSAGDSVTLAYDNGASFTVVFLASDATQAGVIARINQYAGFAFAAASAGAFTLTGIIQGLNGAVNVVGASSPGVLTALGLTVGTTAGTGNVGNILQVKFSELQSLVHATDAHLIVEQLSDGSPRIVNTGVPGTGTLQVMPTSTALAFGFPMGVVSSAATGNSGTIPAGTPVNDGTNYFVTMQTINVTGAVQTGVPQSGPGPYSTPIRHATDDGTGAAALAGAITNLGAPVAVDAYVVINLLPTTAALTENQLDNAYLTALAATIDINTVAKDINIICAARQSNAVRQGLKQNAEAAPRAGLSGRIAHVRPPLGTAPNVAISQVAQPGVGATTDDRVVYNYPGTSTRIAAMAQVGVAGGAGFTADGIIDVGSDTWEAAFESILPPEENPGQDPTNIAPFMANALGLESSPYAQNLQLQDYINFKAAGISAARYGSGTLFFQSGIMSDTTTIARRRMADYLQDTIANICQPFVKKLNKSANRKALKAEIISFFESLLGRTNENQRRIAGYTVDDSVSTPNELQRGLYRIITNARNLSSLDDIALMSTVGEDVTVVVLAPGETQ